MQQADKAAFSYEDIVNEQRPISRKHRPMDRRDRAAQFASFAALTGHKEQVADIDKQKDMEE